jgi:hypothetical protein
VFCLASATVEVSSLRYVGRTRAEERPGWTSTPYTSSVRRHVPRMGLCDVPNAHSTCTNSHHLYACQVTSKNIQRFVRNGSIWVGFDSRAWVIDDVPQRQQRSQAESGTQKALGRIDSDEPWMFARILKSEIQGKKRHKFPGFRHRHGFRSQCVALGLD